MLARPALPLIAVVLLSGCPKNLKLPDLSAYTPKVRFDRVDLGKADWNGVDAEFVLSVDNPNPVGVKLAKWSWDLDVAGTDFLAGANDSGAELQARGASELAIPTRLAFKDLIATAQAAKGQAEVPFAVSGDLGFNTPLGVVTVPWKDAGTLPVLRKPRIRVQGLRVEKLDLLGGKVNLALDLGVTNEGGGTLDLDDVAWTLDLGGKRVADGTAPNLATVAAGQEQTVSLPIGLKVVELGSSVVNALKNKSDLPVAFGADASVGTPLGALPLNISESTTVKVK